MNYIVTNDGRFVVDSTKGFFKKPVLINAKNIDEATHESFEVLSKNKWNLASKHQFPKELSKNPQLKEIYERVETLVQYDKAFQEVMSSN